MEESLGEMFCDCDFKVLNNISVIYFNQVHEFAFATYLKTPSVPDVIRAAITTCTQDADSLRYGILNLFKKFQPFPQLTSAVL
jgi:hypothetical protein